MARSLRDDMPMTAAWIDDMRAAFGKDEIDAAIKRGMQGGIGFHAIESGHEVGTPIPDSGAELARLMLKARRGRT